MTAAVVIPALAAWLSIGATLVVGVELQPDVGLYTSGVGLFPSPLGTLVGVGGVDLLALSQAVAIAGLVALVLALAPPLGALAIALPVLAWLVPLGVDAASVLLLGLGWLTDRRGAFVAAGALHAAALPLWVAREWSSGSRRLAVALAAVCVLVGIATPYGAGAQADVLAAMQGALCGLLVVLVGLGPALVLRLRVSAELATGSLAVGLVAAYAVSADVAGGAPVETAFAAATRYGLPLVFLALVVWHRGRQADGRTERPTTAPRSETDVKRLSLLLGVVMVAALVVVPAAFAQTVPAIPVDEYGDSLLSSLATAIGAIFPYAAAITAFAIGVGMVKRWLGHRKATRV